MTYETEVRKIIDEETERYTSYDAHDLGNAVEAALLRARDENRLPISLRMMVSVIRARLEVYDEVVKQNNG